MLKRLAVGLLVPAFLLLAACSTNDNGALNNSGVENATNNKDKGVNLKISLTAQDMSGLETLATEYNSQNPDVTITVDRAPDNQFKQTLGAQLSAKEAPDMFVQWPGLSKIGLSIDAGYLADLSDVAPLKNIDPSLLQGFSKEEKVYGIPWSKNYLAMFYNKDIFQAHDIAVPTNWEEFLAACEKLKAAGITPIALAGKEAWNVQLPWYALAPSTVYAQEQDWDQKRFNDQVQFATSDSWKAVAAQYEQLVKNGYFDENTLGVSYESAKTSLGSGKAAMMIDGNWSIGGYEEIAKANNIDIGMFALPGNKAGEEIWLSSAPSTGLSIWSGSEHQEEAKKFLVYLFSDENYLTLIGPGQFSTLQTVQSESTDITADIVEVVQNAPTYQFLDIGWPAGPNTDAFNQGTQSAIGGAVSFAELLDIADKSWDKAVKK
ncbi:extracellular solute-binding protein [Paenibacillus sp. ACRRY]|uniref:ABC transporter substrate-binding protein n=1 Tax=Paenibacillus sp. ACRRY TaxID=2918208 RepID=UPI001EF4E34B|nr:extracellular solute-binding protein [Paenibacillus sp. ACRRY]MCG7382990.1 extracellular solute-binding protein [Paenibacillus sp. ACRRY]